MSGERIAMLYQPLTVVAHRWSHPRLGSKFDIAVGNWRDGDYNPKNPQEKWMMENGYRIQRAYHGSQEEPLPITQVGRHPLPLVVPCTP